MTRSATAARIGAELVPVLLVLGCLGGALALVVEAHRRQAVSDRHREEAARYAAEAAPVAPAPRPVPRPAPPPIEPEPEPEPPEDPTPRLVAAYAARAAEQRLEAERADARAAALEAARRRAEAEATRLRRREGLVRGRAARLDELAARLESEADALARSRDVLAQRRDREKAELVREAARARDAFAVLPYRGEHGTWRRPIPLECRDGTVSIRPRGPTFSLLELAAGGFGVRSSPLVGAVARELARARTDVAPDGGPVVPYVLFLIRPDGIRPYYEARGRLERLGLAFGYELVEPDVELDFPDLDDPAEWPGAPPRASSPAWPDRPADPAPDRPGAPSPYVWHAPGPRGPAGSALGTPVGSGGRGEAGRGEGGRVEGRRGVDVDGLDLSGPPISFEPDPRRPTGSGGGPVASGRLAGGSGRLAGLTPSGRPGGTGADGGRPQARGPATRSPDGSDGAPEEGPSPGRLDGGAAPAPDRPIGLEGDGPGSPSPPSDRPGAGGRSPGVGVADAAGGGGGRAPGTSPGSGAGAGDGPGHGLGSPSGMAASGSSPLGLAGLPEPGGGTPLGLVVECRPDGVTVQPGGYRLSRRALESSDLLLDRLRAIARDAPSGSGPSEPCLHFLVHPGGEETFWLARRRTTFAGLDWPATLRVAESGGPGPLPGGLR